MAEICIFGAGSIGCYVGGRLAATGSDVCFVGRERIAAQVRDHGLHLTDYLGADLRVKPEDLRFTTDPESASNADLVLVTVKSAATPEAAATLDRIIRPDAVVVSLQNGLHNAETLASGLGSRIVLTGMVQFNVINRGAGAFHQGSEGSLEASHDDALTPWLDAFKRAGLPLELHDDMRAVQWAKLQLNLNNAINALSGIPLKEELSQRDFRRCLALAQQELLDLLEAADVQPARLTPLPPHWLPRLLTVPDWLFRLLANRMLAIDPLARSSMWEDLEAGRATEVDVLNGEVMALAAKLGDSAPVNAKLVALVHAAESGGRRDWSGSELLQTLQNAGPNAASSTTDTPNRSIES